MGVGEGGPFVGGELRSESCVRVEEPEQRRHGGTLFWQYHWRHLVQLHLMQLQLHEVPPEPAADGAVALPRGSSPAPWPATRPLENSEVSPGLARGEAVVKYKSPLHVLKGTNDYSLC